MTKNLFINHFTLSLYRLRLIISKKKAPVKVNVIKLTLKKRSALRKEAYTAVYGFLFDVLNTSNRQIIICLKKKYSFFLNYATLYKNPWYARFFGKSRSLCLFNRIGMRFLAIMDSSTDSVTLLR